MKPQKVPYESYTALRLGYKPMQNTKRPSLFTQLPSSFSERGLLSLNMLK